MQNKDHSLLPCIIFSSNDGLAEFLDYKLIQRKSVSLSMFAPPATSFTPQVLLGSTLRQFTIAFASVLPLKRANQF
jgi:hypothetical protein